MADFVKDAFDQAEMKDMEKELNAWKDLDPEEMKRAMLAAILAAGPIDMTRLIILAQKENLEDFLHSYENTLMMAGFSMGYQAGRQSMLEDTK